jgi:hypothetical protein
VHVHDLNATLLHLLGIDHERLTYRAEGRDYRLRSSRASWSSVEGGGSRTGYGIPGTSPQKRRDCPVFRTTYSAYSVPCLTIRVGVVQSFRARNKRGQVHIS